MNTNHIIAHAFNDELEKIAGKGADAAKGALFGQLPQAKKALGDFVGAMRSGGSGGKLLREARRREAAVVAAGLLATGGLTYAATRKRKK